MRSAIQLLLIAHPLSDAQSETPEVSDFSMVSNGFTFGVTPSSWTGESESTLSQCGQKGRITGWAIWCSFVEPVCAGCGLSRRMIAVIRKAARRCHLYLIGFSCGIVENSVAQLQVAEVDAECARLFSLLPREDQREQQFEESNVSAQRRFRDEGSACQHDQRQVG